MWISKKEYEKLKQEAKDAEYYKAMSQGYESEATRYKILYTTLKNQFLKLFEVEIYLQILKPITYNIKASSPEEAEQCAIKMFKDNNKDFSTSDIVMITVKPMNCAK